MTFQYVIALCLVAVANAGLLSSAQVYQPAQTYYNTAPIAVAQKVLTKSVEEYDSHPQYNFAYDIEDGLTGDSKSQSESRDGDLVTGQYSLTDPDGKRRTVDYTADSIHGFNAVVRREPIAVKSAGYAASPTVIKSYAAPTLVRSAPLGYGQSYAASPYAYSH